MKKRILRIGAAALILFALVSCSDPEAGPDGKSTKVVDSNGKELGVLLNSDSGVIINNGNYTYTINWDTGKINSNIDYSLYATEIDGSGKIYLFYYYYSNFYYYPNRIVKDSNKKGFYMIKARDSKGYVNEYTPLDSVTYKSRWLYGEVNWNNTQGTIDGKFVEVEKVGETSDDSIIIGFEPVLPLKFVW